MAFSRNGLAPLLGLVVFGCATAGLRHVEPRYRDADLSNERIIVYPVDRVRIEPRARELFEAEFQPPPGTDSEAILRDSFDREFQEALREGARDLRPCLVGTTSQMD